MLDVELVKFGEGFNLLIPSQAPLANSEREGVETRRQAPKTERYGEGIVQTTNSDNTGSENYSGTKIPRRKSCRFESGSRHQLTLKGLQL